MPEERKLVSILFADVTGSTALADEMDAEDVRALMSRYYEHARRLMVDYGGTLEKFIGDAIMAVFGLSQAHGDDAERALAAALALREAIAGDEVLAQHIQLRIGVNTGEVVATSNPQSLDFLITGDAVNVAARLQQGAKPGEIIASERTASAAQNAFLFKAERELVAKGKPRPLRIFPLKGPRAKRQSERPPFVGRRQDLLQLAILKERTLEEKRPQLVSIVAPAGTGKSRLLEEFLSRIDPAEGFQVAVARCLPYGQTLTYWPLRGLLSELLGGASEKDRVQAVFLQGGYSAGDASRLAELVLTTLGVDGKDGNAENRATGMETPSAAPGLPANGFPLGMPGPFTPGSIPPGAFDPFTPDATPPGVSVVLTDDASVPGVSSSPDTFSLNLDGFLNQLDTLSGKAKTLSDKAKTLKPPKDVKGWLNLPGISELKDLGISAFNEIKTLSSSSTPENVTRINELVPDTWARISEAGQTLGQQGQALAQIINAQVNQALREVVPSRFRANDRESIFTAWRLLIETLAAQAPRIIVFEDLHWASDNLLDLVEYLVHTRTTASMLMIALCRPELLDRRPAWGGGRQNFTMLSLQLLGEQQIRELVTRLGDTLPADICDGIVARAGGNPFFALELLHAFSEQRGQDEVATLAALPDTVHAAVLARIDLLSRQERTVLQLASVASRTFQRALLAALLEDYDDEEIDAALSDLVARDMLVQLEGETYNFRHILFRDVAYGTLARSERIRLHSGIARWMEVNAGERLNEYIELIAYHYRETIRLSRQSAVPQALPFKQAEVAPIFERAGLLAGRAGSFAEANRNLLFAIELAPASEHVRLQEERGGSVSWLGNIPYEAYSEALKLWRATDNGDPAIGARLIRKILTVTTRINMSTVLSPEEIVALRAEGLALAERAGRIDEHWRLRVHECFEPKFWFNDRRKAAQADLPPLKEIALRAASYFEQQQNWAAMSEALDGCTTVSVYMHNWQDALQLTRRRLTIPDLPAEEWVDVFFCVALVSFWLGNYAGVVSTIQSALNQLKPGHPVASLGKLITTLAANYFLIGEWDEVVKLLPRLREIYELTQYDQHASKRLTEGYIAVLQVALAREERAMIDAASTILQKDAHLQHTALQGYIAALLTGEIEKITPVMMQMSDMADSILNSLLPLFLEQGKFPSDTLLHMIEDGSHLEPSCMEDYLKVFQALRADDNALLAQAIDQAEAHQLIPHAARMRIVLAQRTGDPAPLAQARPVLERLGDRQFLRRLEEVAASL